MKPFSGYDLRTLEVFTQVCELRSMTLAAQRLGMTQPAVSQAIRHLEDVLGVPLVDRRSRPLTLTAAGEWLTRTAGQVLQDARQIALTIRQFGEGRALRLRIGLVDSLSDPFVPAMMRRLTPTVHYLSISSGLASTLRAGLIDRSLDLIITNDPLDDIGEVRKIPILTEPYLLVVPASINAQDVSLADLASAMPLIRWNARSQTGADIERQLGRPRIDLRRQFEFDSARTILGMVAAELGWAIMTPLSIFEMTPVLSKVRLLPFPGPSFSRTIVIAVPPGENETIAEQIGRVSVKLLRDLYVPEILNALPWLAFDTAKDGKSIRIGSRNDLATH
jgi:DNA-binding transcriptional LysR family regulator